MVNIEDIFGDSIRARREREKEFLPDIEWFSKIEPDRLDTFMAKYPFTSFDAIPQDSRFLHLRIGSFIFLLIFVMNQQR